MKRMIIALSAATLVCGVCFGQQQQEPNPNLQCFGPFIGNWRYEGELLEDVPDIAEKGTDCVFQFTWVRILDKNAVECRLFIEFAGGATYSEKTLFGWNAAEKKIVYGGIASDGMMYMRSTTPGRRTLTFESTGKNAEGKDTSYQGSVAKKDKDTMTWKAIERVGAIVEGPSPTYEFKRVPRQKQTPRVKKAE